MGRLPSNNRAYQIQELQSRHREILRLAALGISRQQIADQLGVTTAVVSYTTNSIIGKAHLSNIQNDRDSSFTAVSKRIKSLAPIAVKVLSKALNQALEKEGELSSNETGVAKDILDRVGHGAVKKIQKDVNHKVTTEKSIEAIKERARIFSNGAIDAETSEIVSNENTEKLGVAHLNRTAMGGDQAEQLSLPIPPTQTVFDNG